MRDMTQLRAKGDSCRAEHLLLVLLQLLLKKKQNLT